MQMTRCFLLSVALMSPASGAVAAEFKLAPHRAIYELVLQSARETGGVRSVTGRIAMEAREKDCHDFELTYRQVMRMASGEGEPNVIDFRSTTRESFDGTRFSFDNRTIVNGEADATVIGTGEKAAGQASIALTRPEKRKVTLTGATVFPTQHLRLVLDAARRGSPSVSVPVYDAADPGDVATDTVAFIGNARTADPKLDGLLTKAKVTDRKVWPVSIAYFDDRKTPDDQAPKFLYSADLLENGVTPSVRLDYGTFVVEGRLVELELFPASGCR